MSSRFPITRMRRLRSSEAMRDLICEVRLHKTDLIAPIFIKSGENIKAPISSMPGQYQFSIDQLRSEVEEIVGLGIKAVLLFGIPKHKDEIGSDAFHDDGIIQQSVREIKKIAPELVVITDVCFCEYTTHGHCGFVKDIENNNDVDNDKTLELLAKQAVSHAKAGCDVVAPSGMMDGMVGAIRQALDDNDFTDVAILSYSAKFCSAMFGAFRDAVECEMDFGSRDTYQMAPANANQAMREVELDVAEGADMLMVKPAVNYLDVIHRIKSQFPQIPLAAYHVSGEYAMIKAAAAKGWIDEQRVMMETLLSIKRSGADLIITYFAKDAAKLLSLNEG